MATDSLGQYEEYIKQWQANNYGVAKWTDIFANAMNKTNNAINTTYNAAGHATNVAYDQAVIDLNKEAQKDIASAYSQYIQSQMNMRYARDYTSGYKNMLQQANEDAYRGAVINYQNQLKTSTDELQLSREKALAENESARNDALLKNAEQYQKAQDEAQSAINKQVTRLTGYETDMLKMWANMEVDSKYDPNNEGLTVGEAYDWMFKKDAKGNVFGWSDDAMSIMYEDILDDKGNATGETKSTKAAQEFMAYIMGQGFDDYMKSTKSAADYRTWIEEDKAMFQTAHTGGTFDKSWTGENWLSEIKNTTRFRSMEMPEGVSAVSASNINDDVAKNVFDMVLDTHSNKSSITTGAKGHVQSNGIWSDLIQKDLDAGGNQLNHSTKSYSGGGYSSVTHEYSIKSGSDLDKQWKGIKKEMSELEDIENLEKGDIFTIGNGKYLAYYDGDDFIYARNDEKIKNKLQTLGITIPTTEKK